jgi:hypothetical protein
MNHPILQQMDAGTFSALDHPLIDLHRAFQEVRLGYQRARKMKSKEARAELLQKLSRYSNVLLKSIARKWRERGIDTLAQKIVELQAKADDDERPLNPYDSVLLEFLKEERAALRNEK